MRSALSICLTASVLLTLPGLASEKPAWDRTKLAAALRPLYSQSTSFSPAALRFPLRTPSYEEVVEAKAKAEKHPDDLGARRRAAVLAEAAEDAGAQGQWQLALGLIEARIRSGKVDAALLEAHVEALVGANLGSRVVPAAERLLKAHPESGRTHLLVGDAYFRRADFNWRVLVRRSAAKDLPPDLLIRMNSDLEAARKAYDRAVELAPADPAPRAGRMSLAMARPIMAAVLPKGVMEQPRLDPLTLRRDLLELVGRNPGQVAPLWHAAHFFATQAGDELPLSASERDSLEQGLGAARAEADQQVFLLEARGLLQCARREWVQGGRQFEAASKLEPSRAFAAEWLANCDANSPEPRSEVISRVRSRIAGRPGPSDCALLGVLLAESEPKSAIETLRQAVKLDGANAVARFNLGVLLLQEQPESIEGRYHLRRALQLRSDDFEAQFAHAVALVIEGRSVEARRAIQAVLTVPELPADLRERAESTLRGLGGGD